MIFAASIPSSQGLLFLLLPFSSAVNKHSLLELAINEFNNGRFFESHDSFEIVWESLHGDDRRFMQGMIHVAIGSFYAVRKNHAGATTQIERAIERLSEHRPEKFGIDVNGLLPQLVALREAVKTSSALPSLQINFERPPANAAVGEAGLRNGRSHNDNHS